MRVRRRRVKKMVPAVAAVAAVAPGPATKGGAQAGAGGAASLERARLLGHSLRNLGGPGSRRPSGGEAVVDRSPLAALVRALQPVGAAGRGGTPGVVQRKGVKSELRAAEITFQDFVEETDKIDELRKDFSDSLYHAYKPSPTFQSYWNPANRDKSRGTVDEKIARLRASRLQHWTETAVSSAQRIYWELEEAANVGSDLSGITMGKDTSVEPDAYVDGTTAVEMKHIDSAAQGSVDSHVAKASKQLSKRRRNKKEGNLKITKWVAGLRIRNGDNPWPYTPARLVSAIRKGGPSQQEVRKTGKARIEKYDEGDVFVDWDVKSDNPMVGEFTVKV